MDDQNGIQLTSQAQKQQEMTQQVNELFALRSEHLENVERDPMTLEQTTHRRQEMVASMRQALCTAIPVVIPKEKTKEEQYSKTKAKESLSASKRKKYSKKEGHPLYRKEQNALLAERLDQEAEERYQMRKSFAEEIDGYQEMSVCEKELIFKLTDSENPMVARERMMEFADKTKRLDMINHYVKELMALNLEGIDLSSDQSLLSQDRMFRRMGELVAGLNGMMELYPDYKATLDRDVKSLFDDKLEKVKKLSDYYRAKKILMTDQYYRSHLNSEVSYVADEEASLEQNRATEKLWMVEQMLDQLKLSNLASRVNESFKDNHPKEVLNVARRLPAVDPEPGKNIEPLAEKRHMGMLRQFKEEHPELAARLDGSGNVHYQIYGSEHSSTESVVRHLHNFSWLRATQVMSDEDLKMMLMQLSKRPEDPANEEQVKEARESNIAGVRAFKSLMRLQIDYLSRKYGAGFFSMKMEDQIVHQEEFADDFANVVGFRAMMDYLRKEPGVWEPEDEALFKALNYQQKSFYMLMGTRLEFQSNLEQGSKMSYADWKKRQATSLAGVSQFQSGVMECIESAKDEHLDLRWDTPFRLTDMADFFLEPERLEERNKKFVKNQNADPRIWQNYFPELNISQNYQSTTESLDKIIEKQVAPMLELRKAEWEKRGVISKRSYLPGIGADDFSMIDQFYNNILKNPSDYHLTAEDTAHFEELMKAWKTDSVELGRLELLEPAAREIVEKLEPIKRRADERKGNQAELNKHWEETHGPLKRGSDVKGIAAEQLERDIRKLHDEYWKKKQEILKRANDIYNELFRFTGEHSLFIVDTHKDLFKSLIEDEAEKMVPTENIDLGSVTIPTFAINEKHRNHSLQSVLNGRQLKAGVNPEEFMEDVKEANRLIARLMKESEIADFGQESDVNYDELDCLKDVPDKKAIFVYETYKRAAGDGVKLDAIKEKLLAQTREIRN